MLLFHQHELYGIGWAGAMRVGRLWISEVVVDYLKVFPSYLLRGWEKWRETALKILESRTRYCQSVYWVQAIKQVCSREWRCIGCIASWGAFFWTFRLHLVPGIASPDPRAWVNVLCVTSRFEGTGLLRRVTWFAMPGNTFCRWK
jgi:hypothetical protein